MAATLVATSAPVYAAAGTNPSTTGTLPAGTASGDRVYMFVASKPTGTIPATPTSWSLHASITLGSVQHTLFFRDYDGVWTMPSVSTTGNSTSTSIGVTAASYRPGTGETLVEEITTGADATSGTGYSVTGSAVLGWTAGDLILLFNGIAGNVTASAEGLTATGSTIGTVTEAQDSGTANGADVAIKVYTSSVSSGTATAAAVHSSTLSGASTGGTMFLRVRSGTGPFAAQFSEQNDNLSTASGVSGSVVTVTCYMRVDADRNTFSGTWGLGPTGLAAQLSLATTSDGTTQGAWHSGAGAVLTGAAMTVGTWYKCAIVMNGTAVTLYMAASGSSLTTFTATSSSALSAPATLAIGCDGFPPEWLNGTIAAVKVWQNVLTQTEIETELTQYDAVRTADLAHSYRLNGSLVDSSGVGSTLTAGTSAVNYVDGPPIPLAVPIPVLWPRRRGPNYRR